MNINSNGKSRLIRMLVVIAIIADLCGTVSRATGTNYVPPDVRYYCTGIIIGEEGTNKVRAGIWPMGDIHNFEVKIMAVPESFRMSRALPAFRPDPAFGAFLKPPGQAKFSKVELRDPDGRVLAPLQKQDGSLPPSLQVRAFPRYSRQEMHDGNIDFQDRLYRSPSELGAFTVQDAYRIEKEGDYTLTVCCAIYILPYNGHPPTNVDYDSYQTLSATRADLRCVTAKIHLAPP
jgi:hypothetical protein